MKCPYCNQEIEDGSTVCPVCGKELNQTPAEETAQDPAAGGDAIQTSGDVSAENQTSGPASAAPEQKGGKKKWGIVAAVAAVVVVVAAAAFLMMPKKNPKDTVVDAFKSIVAEGQVSPLEEIFGFGAMGEKFSKESGEVAMSLRLEDISDTEMQQAVSGELNVDFANDVPNKKLSYGIGIGYADMDLASFDFYMDTEKLAAAIPELSQKVFTLNYADDLEGQIESSPYIGQYIAESGVDITGFDNYLAKCSEMASSGKELFNLKELWKRYKEGSKAIDDLKASMTVEKTDKKNFTIDGKDQNCNGYNVTITKDALLQFLTTSKEFFLSDETLKQDFVEYINLVMELQSAMIYAEAGMEDMTAEQMQEETWKSAEEGFNTVMEQLKESMDDVSLVVYVTGNGKMASFDYNTTATVEEEQIKIYGTVSFAGGYSMMGNVKATLNLEDTSGEVINITYDKTGEYEAGKSYKTGVIISASMTPETYSIELTGDYDIEGKKFNASADFLGNGQSAFKITSSGVVNDLVKGESIDVAVDSLRMDTSLLSGAEDYIDMSGAFKMGPLTKEVAMPTGEEMDVLAATEDEWNTVASEIMGNAFGLLMGLE